MPFIPNAADAFHESQASPDSGHFETLRAGSKATGVVSGCAVTAQGTPDMTVAVASGVVSWEGTKANVTAGNLTLTADGTDPRFYLIVASSAGVKSAVAGDPAPEMDPPTVAGPVFPAVPATSVVLASVYVPAADTDIDANQIDDMRVFVVPPEPTTNYDLSKALSIPLVKDNSQTVTLDSGQNQVHASALVSSKMWGATNTSPAQCIRFNNLEDLTDRTSFAFGSDGFHNEAEAMIYITEKDRLYVLFNNASRILVSEVNLTTHAVTDVINDTSRVAGTSGSLASDGTNLFVLTNATPSKVVKYRLSDYAFVAEVTLTGLNAGHTAIYDGESVYCGGNVNPGWVAKVNPSDLTFTSVVLSSASVGNDSLASVGDYLFVATEGFATQICLFRIYKDDLTRVESVFTGEGTIYALKYDGQWLWATHQTTPGSPGRLTRLDPQNLTTATHTFESGEEWAGEIHTDRQRLFVFFWLSPAKVKRLVPPALSSLRLPDNTLLRMGGSLTTGTLVGVRNLEHVTDANAGSSEETLGTAALTANTLSADKKALRLTASGKFAANANAKRILLKFGVGSPVTVFDTGSLLFNDANWWLEALCVRTSEDNQKWTCKWTSDSSLLATDVTPPVLTTQNDGAAINILVRGVGVAASDVTCELLLVEMIN